MLGQSAFYHNIIRKYIIAFGSLFNDIHVIRSDATGTQVKDIKVPITFASKDKARYQINSLHSRVNESIKIGQILPRISYILNNSIEYDNTRIMNPLLSRQKRIDPSENFAMSEVGIGKPYNFIFQLSIWTKYLDDMFQIVEQVLSFFNPDYHVTIKEIPELNVETSIPIVYQGCAPSFETEFDDTSWRVLRFDIDFSLKGWIYPPIRDESIINNIKMNFHSDIDSDDSDKIAILRTEYDAEDENLYSVLVESDDANFDVVDDLDESIETLSQITLKVYKSATEPVLSDDEFAAYWFKLDSEEEGAKVVSKYYIQKSETTQTLIEI